MNDMENSGINRRESFRLADTVTLRIRLLDEEAQDAITEDFNAFRLRYCLKSHLQYQNEVRKPQFIKIKKSNSDIAAYLEGLEKQIAMLAERLDQDSDSEKNTVELTVRADLSATGLRFRSDMPLVAGNTIEIGMVLNTLNTQVVMLGEVLRADETPEGATAISVRYSHIHPEDTESIIRHLARLQQLELRARRDLE